MASNKEASIEEEVDITPNIKNFDETEPYLNFVCKYLENLIKNSTWTTFIVKDFINLRTLEDNDSPFCHLTITFTRVISSDFILKTLNIPSRRLKWDTSIKEINLSQGDDCLDGEFDILPAY